MVAGGKTLMDVSTSNFLLQSSNWGVSGQKAAQFNIKNGKITLRQNAANDGNIVIMDIGAGTYPFQIGSIIPNTTDRKFRVSWDGKMFADDADIKGVITATSGSFTGSIYASGGSITGSLSVAGKLTGNGWEINRDGASFTKLAIDGMEVDTVQGLGIVFTKTVTTSKGLRTPTIEGTYAGNTTRLKITTDVEFGGDVYGLTATGNGVWDGVTFRDKDNNLVRLVIQDGFCSITR